jgi:hypothetical protein
MNPIKTLRLLLAVGLVYCLAPQSLFACAACFGKSDSSMAQGLNMGIFSLLAVVLFVLGGFVALIIFLARRGAAYAAQNTQLSETTNQS